MPSVAPLARVYIEALCGRAIYVHAGLKGKVSHLGFGQFRKKGLISKMWFARAAHAELVMLRVCQDFRAIGAMRAGGWIDVSPAETTQKVKLIAGQIGAKWQTQGQIERDAERVVAEITRRVKDARMDGELKEVNARYKIYRQAQIEKSELAVPYSAYMMDFIRLLVVRAAQKSMTG